jgi:hypothetical protein
MMIFQNYVVDKVSGSDWVSVGHHGRFYKAELSEMYVTTSIKGSPVKTGPGFGLELRRNELRRYEGLMQWGYERQTQKVESFARSGR